MTMNPFTKAIRIVAMPETVQLLRGRDILCAGQTTVAIVIEK